MPSAFFQRRATFVRGFAIPVLAPLLLSIPSVLSAAVPVAAVPGSATGFSTAALLDRRAANWDRVKSASFNVMQDMRAPRAGGKPARVTTRLRMNLERLRAGAWRIEVEFRQPRGGAIRIEGHRVWRRDQDGRWVDGKPAPAISDYFTDIAETFMGAGALRGGGGFAARETGRSRTGRGTETATVELNPRSASAKVRRIEEDVNADGLALVSRAYDAAGGWVSTAVVTEHRKVEGMPFATSLVVGRPGTAGETTTVMRCGITRLEMNR